MLNRWIYFDLILAFQTRHLEKKTIFSCSVKAKHRQLEDLGPSPTAQIGKTVPKIA